MKKNASKQSRRQALEQIFDSLTRASRMKAMKDYPGGWNDCDDAKGAMVVRMFKAVDDILRGLVAEPPQMPLFGEAFENDLREFLEYRPILIYEAWHVREDLTDEEIDEAVLTMQPGKYPVKDLEKYRAPKDRFEFESTIVSTFTNYRSTLTNLAYTTQTAALLAKDADAPEAARHFLRLRSIFSAKAKSTAMAFKPNEIDDIIDWYERGREDLLLALDYAALGDWKTRRDEVRELLKSAETEASK